MKAGKDTKRQANKLIEAMRIAEVPAFHVDRFGLTERSMIESMVKLAKYHCSIQVHHCNGTATKRIATRETNIECRINTIAANFGLKAVFDGDPRGYTVKLHAPNNNVGNTWGGDVVGWGIG